jgi:hypothetical protein
MVLVLEATQREPTVATKLAELHHLHRPATIDFFAADNNETAKVKRQRQN